MQDLIAVIIFVSIGLGCIFGLNMFLNKQTKDKIDQCGSFEVQGCKYWQCIADKSLYWANRNILRTKIYKL